MIITYANKEVELYFTDFSQMKRVLPFDWVRSIRKHLEHLEAAETFGDFLSLGLGKPEPLAGQKGVYSLHVSRNVRLIIMPSDDKKSVMLREIVEIEGVCDYHGGKENWFIS